MRKGQMLGVLIFRPGNVRAWQFLHVNVLRTHLSSLFISSVFLQKHIGTRQFFVAQDMDRILGPNSTSGLTSENNVCSHLDPGV